MPALSETWAEMALRQYRTDNKFKDWADRKIRRLRDHNPGLPDDLSQLFMVKYGLQTSECLGHLFLERYRQIYGAVAPG